MRLQGVPAGTLRDHLRAADDRAIRVRPGVTLSGTAPWVTRGGNSRALGAFARNQSEHAARQRSNVRGYINDPVEFIERALPAEEVTEIIALCYKVLDRQEFLR